MIQMIQLSILYDTTTVTCKMRARVVFTRTGWTRSYKITESSDTDKLPNSTEEGIFLNIAKVDAINVYPNANTEIGRLPYKFENGAFYMYIWGPLHKKQ